MRKRVLSVMALPFVGIALAFPTYAQRTDDNVTAESDDAFGRSVGYESIGIYNPGEVRGFSPIDAGNVRIEGLYFDRQTDPTHRLVEGSSIRIGIAAQRYPFPSPTGILDYDLRRVGDDLLVSPVLLYGPFGGMGVEFDAQIPLLRHELGIAVGAGLYNDRFAWGGSNRGTAFAIVPRWRPSANVEVRPFFGLSASRGEEPQPLMLTAGGALPPRIRRERYFGQSWEQNRIQAFTYGLIGQARLGAWTARLGLFESIYAPDIEFADLFTDIRPDGQANEIIIAADDSRFASRSGELRLMRTYEEAEHRHTLFLSARGRVQQRRYGGEAVIEAGSVQLGAGRPIPLPDLVFAEHSHDEVRQKTAGISYELQWKDRGEIALGVQKTAYTKSVQTPAAVLPVTHAHPVLVNAASTLHVTKGLAVYGSYTEGLEESPVAPSNAANRNVAAPALRTEQYDAGIRNEMGPHLKLIAGVFSVRKPYFDLDASGAFTALGSVKHRGVELSLSGNLSPNLTVVAGGRILDAKVTGPVVAAGLIGKRPVGSARTYGIANVDYQLFSTGVSVDATVEGISRQVANANNNVKVPSRAVLHLGTRYQFTLLRRPATLRAQVSNVFDAYGWQVISGGAYVYNQPRRLDVYLAADW